MCVSCYVVVVQHRNEDEEVERELTKMDERFKIYDRRREKEKAAAKAAAKDAASKYTIV